MTVLLNKRGEKVVRLVMEDGKTHFVNLKKLTQHNDPKKAETGSSSLNSATLSSPKRKGSPKRHRRISGVDDMPDGLVLEEPAKTVGEGAHSRILEGSYFDTPVAIK